MEPALIPAAGKGTRLRPITRHLSKPMLPLGSTPVIHYSIREALDAGCSRIVVIRGSADLKLHNYVRENFGDRVRLAVQKKSRGLAHALLRGYERLDDPERCAVLLPDNVILNGKGIGSLLEVDEECSIMGTTVVNRTDANYFGNSGDYGAESIGAFGLERIRSLQSKGEGSFSRRYDEWPVRRSVARNLLTTEFFQRARNRSPDPDTGEVDDVPILRSMIKSTRVLGFPVDGDVYDMGTPERYLRLTDEIFEQYQTSNGTDLIHD